MGTKFPQPFISWSRTNRAAAGHSDHAPEWWLQDAPVVRDRTFQEISVQGQAITGPSPLEKLLSNCHQIKPAFQQGKEACERVTYRENWPHKRKRAALFLLRGAALAPLGPKALFSQISYLSSEFYVKVLASTAIAAAMLNESPAGLQGWGGAVSGAREEADLHPL